MVKKSYRKFNGKRYMFRASYHPSSVKSSIKNMRKNGWLVRTIKRDDGVDVYVRSKLINISKRCDNAYCEKPSVRKVGDYRFCKLHAEMEDTRNFRKGMSRSLKGW